MIDIALPVRLREPFKRLANAVLAVFPEGDIALGGGTVLEARWSHRISTDLDLFISPRNLGVAYDAKGGRLYPMLGDALRAEGIGIEETNLTIGRESVFLGGHCADGTPWSLAEMHYSHPDQPMAESVDGTGIRAATITETMMGKIVGRAYVADERTDNSDKQPIPIRDCYDICVCAAIEPEVLARIFNIIPLDARTRIARNLRDAPHDLHLRDKKPLITPTWVVPLPGIASQIGEAIALGDVERLPVARPPEFGVSDNKESPAAARGGASGSSL
ncbi:MAG: nucleotidyl transferase AbiEii/AbiGii toxin family protein [Gammaproteobacteria bacterium]|nr:nucleotidyl transferase AbiEii/AbiGii toxin family protein [Gammaproteobacteria bacterium]MDD9963817.1 nucleotidyl transferase AbiEii/AbiGii toxin family protein [Gammaproteobacteria bacterium]MDE0273793.1 nucleotidyl transferase AbiEii/AbiGii toxin family protein [Gammaproteobacteria bacterium]